MGVFCAGACALPWDIPSPTLIQHPCKGHPCLLSSLASHWVMGSQDLGGREGVCSFEQCPLGKSNMWRGKEYIELLWVLSLPTKYSNDTCSRKAATRYTKGICHGLGSPSSTCKIHPFCLQLQRRAMVILSPMMLSCPELHKPVLLETETREQEIATKAVSSPVRHLLPVSPNPL